MIHVFPVYAGSLVISQSTHEALLGPAYAPVIPNHGSTEIHTVAFLPGPWQSLTSPKTRFDGLRPALDGHDTGMMIPHLSPNMANLYLPTTLLCSSCSWPFVSYKTWHRDGKSQQKPMVCFFPVIAPFQFCDSPAEAKPSSKDDMAEMRGKGEVRLPGRNGGKVVELGPKIAKKPLRPKRKHRVALSMMKERAAAAKVEYSKIGFQASLLQIGQVQGRGKIYIPMGKTVLIGFSLLEMLAGWAKLFVANAISAVAGGFLKPLKFKTSPLDPTTAARKYLHDSVEHLAIASANKLAWDGLAKSFLLQAKVQAPFGIFSYSPGKGEGHFLGWDLAMQPWPLEFRGVAAFSKDFFKIKPAPDGETSEPAENPSYLPAVEQLCRDNPNTAGG